MRFGHRFESRYYQRSTLNDSLMVAWPLDEASGTRYPDYGGTEFDLTDVDAVGTADAPSGIGGLCANLNGTSEYLYCADPFAPPAALSVFAWVYPGSVGATAKVVAAQGRGANNNLAWQLYINTATVTCGLTTNGTTVTSATSGTIGAAAWSFVGFAWNGSSVVVYNGLSAGTPAAFASALYDSSRPLTIGANDGGSPLAYFPGRIAQPVIWSKAVSAPEVAYMFNGGNGRPLSDWLA